VRSIFSRTLSIDCITLNQVAIVILRLRYVNIKELGRFLAVQVFSSYNLNFLFPQVKFFTCTNKIFYSYNLTYFVSFVQLEFNNYIRSN